VVIYTGFPYIHALWHLLSTYGGYTVVVSCSFLDATRRKPELKPRLKFSSFSYLPYVDFNMDGLAKPMDYDDQNWLLTSAGKMVFLKLAFCQRLLRLSTSDDDEEERWTKQLWFCIFFPGEFPWFFTWRTLFCCWFYMSLIDLCLFSSRFNVTNIMYL